MRPVNRHVGQVEEKRALPVVADEAEGVVGEAFRIPVGLAAVDALVAKVEAILHGRLRREVLHRQVPLARNPRAVSAGLQRLHERVASGLDRVGQTGAGGSVPGKTSGINAEGQRPQRLLHPRVRMHPGNVVGAPVPARELPGHDRGAARAAHGLAVGAEEDHALPRDPVHVRRLQHRIAGDARTRVGHIVDEDEDDVGSRLGGCGRAADT